MLPFPVTFGDRQRHLPIAFSNGISFSSCAVVEMIQLTESRGPSAIAQLFVRVVCLAGSQRGSDSEDSGVGCHADDRRVDSQVGREPARQQSAWAG